MSEVYWWLYFLNCDGRLYTGISIDPDRRYQEHLAGGVKGSRFTRAAKHISLCWKIQIGDHSLALKAEYRLRRLPRARKLQVIAEAPKQADLLQLLNLQEST